MSIMTHDPCCPYTPADDLPDAMRVMLCQCGLISRVRADERARVEYDKANPYGPIPEQHTLRQGYRAAYGEALANLIMQERKPNATH